MTLSEDLDTVCHVRITGKKKLQFVFQINSEITFPRFQDFHDFISTLRQLQCNKRKHISNNIIMVNRTNSQIKNKLMYIIID